MASVPDENNPKASEASPAEGLAQSHQPYVEDAPPDDTDGGESSAWGETMSAKAAGKRPEAAFQKGIDVSSLELFPTLGKGPAAETKQAKPTWGPRNGHANGSGAAPPSSASASSRPVIVLPGRSGGAPIPQHKNVEFMVIDKEHILPRDKLKRSIPDIIKDISRRSRVNLTVSMATDGRHRFEARGPPDVAQQALKDLVQQIGTKVIVTVPIPQSSRAYIIGKGGATIKAIQERTGARIKFPRPEETTDDDDDSEILITIEGNTVSAALARDEIFKIVEERSSGVQSKVKGIPSAFYPFLAARMAAMEEANRVRIQVPSLTPSFSEPIPTEPADGEPPLFTSTDGSYIQIQGDRSSVQRTRAEIERLAADLHNTLQVRAVGVDHGSQQFIIGEHGITMQDFFSDTGCAVLLPPDDTSAATLVGPADCLDKGWDKALKLIDEMRSQPFNLARGNDGVVYARNVTRYLHHRGEIVRIQKTHGTVIQTPHYSGTWQIYSRQMRNVANAQAELTKILAGLPTSRISTVPVDPFFHAHLQKNVAPRIRESYGVQVVVPEGSNSTEPVLLVYEAPFQADASYNLPTSQPSKKDIDSFRESLRHAENHILELIKKQEEVQSVSIDVPHKFHDKLKRFIKREKEKLPDDQVPIRVSSAGTKVTLRGPASIVRDMAQRVEKFVEQEKQDEKERGFTLSFDFPQKFASHLIGKQGSKISELREKFDVEIQVDKGVVQLKGPKAKAEVAKAHILSLGRTLEDEMTYTLKIDPKFHGELIGAQGAHINKLQTRCPGVHIFFPRTAKPADDSDGASESEKPRRQQAADEVVIRGPRKAADQARDELFELYKHIKDTSFTATVTLPQKQIPSIIGQGGAALEALRMSSGARIDIPADRGSDMVEIQLKGTQAQVALAKKELQEKKVVFEDTVAKTVEVDRKYHKTLIGTGGKRNKQAQGRVENDVLTSEQGQISGTWFFELEVPTIVARSSSLSRIPTATLSRLKVGPRWWRRLLPKSSPRWPNGRAKSRMWWTSQLSSTEA